MTAQAEAVGLIPKPPGAPPGPGFLAKIAAIVAILAFVELEIYLLLPERPHEGTVGPAAVTAPAGSGQRRTPEGHPATPPAPGALHATATPDPAHILRVYVTETSLQPRHFRVAGLSEVYFAVENLDRKACTLRISGPSVLQVETVPAAQERMFPLTQRVLQAGTYRISVLPNDRERASGDLLVEGRP